MFTLDYCDIIRDPIHRYIGITSIEKKIINSPWLQRLRHIKQTPSVSYVYPGANHTRFEHSLGVMHVGGMWAEHLLRNEYIDSNNEGRNCIKKQIQKVRLAGLLHDVGHGPFSHSFEFYFLDELIPDNRINHECMGIKIVNEYLKNILLPHEDGSELGENEVKLEKNDVKLEENDVEDITAMIRGIERDPQNRFLYKIIASKSIDADKIDYILRDGYYSGAEEFGGIDAERLILNSYINSDRELVHNKRSYYAHQHFWLARAHMYRNLYLHRTSVAYDIFFGYLLKLIESKYQIIEKIKDLSYYQTLTDATFFKHI